MAMCETLLHSAKVLPRGSPNGTSLYRDLEEYFRFYNHERGYSSLGMRTPAECYHDR